MVRMRLLFIHLYATCQKAGIAFVAQAGAWRQEAAYAVEWFMVEIVV